MKLTPGVPTTAGRVGVGGARVGWGLVPPMPLARPMERASRRLTGATGAALALGAVAARGGAGAVGGAELHPPVAGLVVNSLRREFLRPAPEELHDPDRPVAVGFAVRKRATAPATCGTAADVPVNFLPACP